MNQTKLFSSVFS